MLDVDTFLTTLYVTVDDFCQSHTPKRKPGTHASLCASEVITLSGTNPGIQVDVGVLADQALTPFGPIAEPNPWGSIGDLRLLPDRDSEVRVDLWEDASPLHFFLCDATNTDGSPWDARPRTGDA